MATKQDIYTKVTDQIIADLEQGVKPWTKAWATKGGGILPFRHNGKPYRGINVLILWIEQNVKGYSSSTWMTYKQAQEYGGQVRKGEHGTAVVYASRFVPEKEKARALEAGEKEHSIAFLKTYYVFNVEQIDNLPERFQVRPVASIDPSTRIARCEEFFRNTGADIRHGGDKAMYVISQDFIQMPKFEAFKNAESYYATLGHENTHWTRHEKRLNRSFNQARWGDEGYAMEELVAEIGAAFICAELDLPLEPRNDHADYIANWLKVLKNDKKAIFTAAAHSEKAVKFLIDLQPHATGDDEVEGEVDLAEAA